MWKVVSIFLITAVLITGVVLSAHTSPTGPAFESPGLRVHFFELTVSPAGVCASLGEQVEISCTIHCVFNTPIGISSVDMLLFDSRDYVVREQRMTRDSYWSFHTAYTILGDEAYYKLKVNFTFPSGRPEEHSEYGAHLFPIVVKR
jgi:hypothetical protein